MCGDPLPSWRAATIEHGICPRCRRTAGAIDRGCAAGLYDGALRSIVHALKYDGRQSIAPRLAALLRSCCADVLKDADAIVPVPLHPRRQWTRGFNQAEAIGRHLGVPMCPVLRRTRDTQPQIELPAAQRHKNIKDAFVVRSAVEVAGKRLVVVDDVSTTGATLQECARVLKRAGARDVRTVTVARVVRSRL